MSAPYYDGYMRRRPVVETTLTAEADEAIKVAVTKALAANLGSHEFVVRAQNAFDKAENEMMKDWD